MSRLVVTVQQDKDLVEAIRKKLAKPGVILKKIGADMVKETGKRFSQGKDPDGNKWEPVKKQTLARRKMTKKKTPLTDTRALRKSVKQKVNKGSKSVVVKGNTGYAAYQNFALYNDLQKPRTFLGHKYDREKVYADMIIKFLNE